ncbi:MAG TPA: acetamidase/formamidase family protein [Gemmatimonadaceae bacterium]|nr:acetamidase/formamidase family protein [Gemmatimonadaceae bacterium]
MIRLIPLALVLLGACRSNWPQTVVATTMPESSAGSRVHRLELTPETVAWGWYDAAGKPVLTIASGDEIDVRTASTCSPTTLIRNGLDSSEVEPEVLRIYAARSTLNPGPGGHILTGPVYVEGADSGDVLEVRIRRVSLAIPYACNSFGGRGGFLPEDFPYSRTKIVRLDTTRMVGKFSDGIEIPLRPFFGSMGVAPPAAMGRVNSAPPGIHAGNLDNKELVAGTTLFIPVHVRGALFEIGDGHAAQGNGEVDITALETSLRGRLQLIVRKDMKLTWPRAETPTHWIAMGIDRDLTQATKIAVREAIALLTSVKGLSRDDAYMLVSTAVDLSITQLVDGTVGVHAMVPKSLFVR